MSVCVSVKQTWHEREHARIHVLENGSKKRDWTGMREKEKKRRNICSVFVIYHSRSFCNVCSEQEIEFKNMQNTKEVCIIMKWEDETK